MLCSALGQPARHMAEIWRAVWPFRHNPAISLKNQQPSNTLYRQPCCGLLSTTHTLRSSGNKKPMAAKGHGRNSQSSKFASESLALRFIANRLPREISGRRAVLQSLPIEIEKALQFLGDPAQFVAAYVHMPANFIQLRQETTHHRVHSRGDLAPRRLLEELRNRHTQRLRNSSQDQQGSVSGAGFNDRVICGRRLGQGGQFLHRQLSRHPQCSELPSKLLLDLEKFIAILERVSAPLAH